MNVWEYFDRIGERRTRLAIERPVNVRLLANVIGCSLVFGFLGALFALFVIPIPKGNEQIVTYMIGQLSGFAGGIVAYHYTSKAGEKELDAKRADTTGKLVDAIKTAQQSGAGDVSGVAGRAADEVADAATQKAGDIKGGHAT